MERRDFIKKVIAAGIVFQLPWYISCQSEQSKIMIPEKEVLSSEQREIVLFFLQHFFPEVKASPSIKDLNTYTHINNYLLDTNIDPDEQKYLINGTKWIDETSMETFNKNFKSLTEEKKEIILIKVLNTSWGTSWSSQLLTLTFESLLLDPLYYVNLQEAGWKWLHHKPGTPRPTNENNYQKLLERKKENLIITDLSQL